MRNAAANTTGTALYSNLLDGCKHSRLREALGGGIAPAPRAYIAPVAPRAAAPALAPVTVSEATTSYFWVAGMSVASLLSIVVTGTITA